MKKLRCPKCHSHELSPPSQDRPSWLCIDCFHAFKIGKKDAKKIVRRSDELGLDLGRLEPFLLQAMAGRGTKKNKHH